MLSSLLVCGNTRNMLSSKAPRVDSKILDREATMEQTVIKVTQEVVRRIAGFETSSTLEPPVDRIYQMVSRVHEKYRAQLDQSVNMLALSDVATTTASFERVLDSMFVGGQINCGRVVSVLAFAGCVAQHCVDNQVTVSADDVDRLAEVMGRQLATRLVRCRYSLVT